MIKRILGQLLILCISLPVSAMDIITLNNGQIVEGKIINKESDGGILLILPSGTKRYIMPEEIDVISQNDIPFYNMVEKENKSYIPKFTVYAAYDNLNYSKINFGDNKLDLNKNSSGISLGFSYIMYLKRGFHFAPALEVAYDAERVDSNYDLSNIFEHYLTDLYSDNRDTEHYWDHWYYYKDCYWFNVRLPLQIGYQLTFNPNMKLQIQTGPVLDCFIGANERDGNLHCSKIPRYLYYSNYDENNDNYYSGLVGYKYNRFNVDWRIGLNLNIKQFMIGITYNVGLTNRLDKGWISCYHYQKNTDDETHCDVAVTPKQMRNYFQLKVGYTF